ncbi:chemotaxis protein CheX [Pseudalkalibacillus sp. SCS-8]|uniref:chemotaxis protein CheX n=1 Tax=Pseudalkalibacillus nanhaiensis TaxID=3115291 RepID=UPI0032DAE3CD
MTIVATENITTLLNGAITVVKTVLPMECEVGTAQNTLESVNLSQPGVMIGLEKEINGSVFFLGPRELFSECGNKMFGMPFEGEMLDSFIGELGNILAGNIATQLSTEDITIDITTPKVVDSASLGTVERILTVPLQFDGQEMTILFTIE